MAYGTTERKWLEFGKMWDAMSEDCNITFGVQFTPTNSGFDDNDGKDDTAYECLKKQYFEEYLEIFDSERINLDLTEKLSEELYAIADKEGVTVDEVVMNILNDYINSCSDNPKPEDLQYGPAECCFHCAHGVSATDYAVKMGCTESCRTTHRSFVCNKFEKN